MPIYRLVSIQDEPEVSISDWSIREVAGGNRSDKTQHIWAILPAGTLGESHQQFKCLTAIKCVLQPIAVDSITLLGLPVLTPVLNMFG